MHLNSARVINIINPFSAWTIASSIVWISTWTRLCGLPVSVSWICKLCQTSWSFEITAFKTVTANAVIRTITTVYITRPKSNLTTDQRVAIIIRSKVSPFRGQSRRRFGVSFQFPGSQLSLSVTKGSVRI